MNEAAFPAIHFFRAGRHTAMSGQEIVFTADDLARAAAAYDPAKWQAPIVVGHPALDAPAYGWVASVADQGGELYAQPQQVEPQFADLVKAGRFKKVSAAWFTPGHPRNPSPGVYYLKHIGFLGAAAPAVSGLRPVEFAADPEDLVLEFGVADGWTVKSLFRRLREWLIQDKGLEAADQVIPEYAIDSIDTELQPAPAAPVQPAFSRQTTEQEVIQVTPEQAAAMEAENQRLAGELATLRASQAEAERLARHGAHAQFAETQVQAGRLTPGMAPLIVAAMDALSALPEPPQFGESDAAQPLVSAMQAAIAAGPVVVDYSERGGANGGDQGPAFAAPAGYQVDAASLDLHQRAVAHMQAHPGTDYIGAIKAVSAA